MTKSRKGVPPKIQRILSASSGNKCAYPGCETRFTERSTDESDDCFVGEICHIYAVSEKGPRWKQGLTSKELNSLGNLILLCPTHHKIVDDQHESYPAETLRQWKHEHEAEIHRRCFSDLKKPLSHASAKLVNQKIENEVNILRKSRFFEEFDSVGHSLKLAKKLTEGELLDGTDAVRSRAIAWCVRFLAHGGKLDVAEKYLDLAKRLEVCIETKIADSFISSSKDGKEYALKILNDIDQPISRTAAFMVVSNHEGPQAAIDWLRTSNVAVTDLDSDGKYFLLACYLDISRWEEARDCVNALSEECLTEETPALSYMIAITHLLMAVPDEFRANMRYRPHFEAAHFPLYDAPPAIDERREAHKHFARAAEAAEKLNCREVAKLCEEYALWLELRDPDPEKASNANRKLEKKLREPKSSLRFVRLGLQFGIKMDMGAIEQEIRKQIAVKGKTHDAAVARLAIAFKQDTPRDVANYINRYRDEIARYLDKKSLLSLQTEAFYKAGQPEKAKKCVEALEKEELSEVEHGRLKRIIAEAEGTDSVEVKKEELKKDYSLPALIFLVKELKDKEKWEELREYAQNLFEETGSAQHAEELSNALIKTRRTDQLIGFIEENTHLLKQSESLKRAYCIALYRNGNLLEARSRLKELDSDWNNENHRALQTQLAISLGDWNALAAIVDNEYSNRDKRSARDLIGIATLAVHLGSRILKDLTVAAAEKGGNDACVLGTVYLLATQAGWEDDAQAQRWLEKAVSLSGDDGPVRLFQLRDFLDRQSEWNQRAAGVHKQLAEGEIPIFLAADSLGKSLADMTLFPALSNQRQKDPRRRQMIPAYSGARQPARIDMKGTIGIDATALITLSFLDLLDKTLDAFDTVCVPHSTLNWLLREKMGVKFHQPSRIKDAHKINSLVAARVLEEIKRDVVPDSELSVKVGEDLAILIAEAEKTTGGDGTQRLVVRPAPVYHVSSLLEEEADLTAHANVLSGCKPVIDKLREKGQLTSKKLKKADAYLRLQEKKLWPNQPEIADGAMLYLDNLSVKYFLHLGVLEDLCSAGFKLVVLPRTISEASALVSYENISDDVDDAIERIRDALNSRIESERIKVAREVDVDTDDPTEQTLLRHPSASIVALAGDCDFVIVDDRFINQNAHIENRNVSSPVFSTLDLLDALASSGSITEEERMHYRASLRSAGYSFIPVTGDELKFYLGNSRVVKNKVVEVAELKAIRESLLYVQMNSHLQFPKEWFWVNTSIEAFAWTIGSLWTADADFADARARSNWIIDQINIQAWANRLGRKIEEDASVVEFGEQVIMAILSAPGMPRQAKEKYWEWVAERILAPIKEQHAALYSWIVEWYEKKITESIEVYVAGEETGMADSPYIRSALARIALEEIVPPLVRDTMVLESDFCKDYKLEGNAILCFGGSELCFQRSPLLDSIRKILSDSSSEELSDTKGRKWKLENTGKEDEFPNIVLSRGKERFSTTTLAGLSPDRDMRLRFLKESASQFNLPNEAWEMWHDILAKRTLENDEIEEFCGDFSDTPVYVAQLVRGGIAERQGDISFLVPNSRKYFERLVGKYDGSSSIQNYAAGGGRKLFQRLSEWKPYDGFLTSLLLSAHPALTDEMQIDRMDKEELLKALDYTEKHGDRISQLGAVEVGLRVLSERPEIESCLVRIIKQIRDDNAEGKQSGFRLLSGLFFLVDGELSQTCLLSSEPPFYRRLAALSQAALIHRQLANSGVDTDSFSEQLFRNFRGKHNIQSLVDMRLEPNWNPVPETPEQVKQNFLGRIMVATNAYERNIGSRDLLRLVFGTEGSIFSASNPLLLYLPGPLDGAGKNRSALPKELADSIEAQITAEHVSPSSFIALINSARMFRLESKYAELAAKSLGPCGYRLADIKGVGEFLATLHGLAAVAAVSRNRTLADELRVLARVYRHDIQYKISAEAELMICLQAAASRTGPDDWREFVGNWLEELAFDELKGDDGEVLLLHLRYLCRIVPGLWASCERAYAALTAYNKRVH